MKIDNTINKIKVRNIEGVVDIKLSEDDMTEVINDNKKVSVKVEGNNLMIGCTEYEPSNKINIFSRVESVVINQSIVCNQIINGQEVTCSGKPMKKANITIKIPYEQLRNLNLAMVGKCIVEGVSKEMDIDASISVELHISDIEEVGLDTSGQTRGKIVHVEKVEIDSSGQTILAIEDASEVELDCSGQSEINISGNTIRRAELDLSGMNKVFINTNELMDLEADMSGMSSVTVKGHIHSKNIDKSGMCSFMNI
ncbi:TPA: DUF2807 domain-containing protein [Clostridium botulinum]|nr:DUF2807 domain-containing protein [Clostridium botulinum]